MCLHFSDSVCVPTKGPKAGEQCIFPFTDGGKTCPGPKCCNTDDSPEGSWCSTKVDANGKHLRGNYAFCEGSPCDPSTHYSQRKLRLNFELLVIAVVLVIVVEVTHFLTRLLHRFF